MRHADTICEMLSYKIYEKKNLLEQLQGPHVRQ